MHTGSGTTLHTAQHVEHTHGRFEQWLATKWIFLCSTDFLSFLFFSESKSSLAQDKKHPMEKVLNLRKIELFTLKKERTNVDSLLKLCGRVKDVIKGDILKALK